MTEPQAALGAEFEAGMRRLPTRAREVFILHDVEGYKHREIAEMLSVTTGTTKAQLHRARMLMRDYLSR
ncbi:RNA polymerase sigma factor [Gemmatimonadota bacterium]